VAFNFARLPRLRYRLDMKKWHLALAAGLVLVLIGLAVV
jgi:hypothetical protein